MNHPAFALKSLRLVLPLALAFLATHAGHAETVPARGGEADVQAYLAGDVLLLPPGNWGQTEQPPISNASIKMLTKKRKSQQERIDETIKWKFENAVKMLKGDKKVLAEIKRAAALYDIDPAHMVGAIIGEHTYNVSTADSLQLFWLNATRWSTDWAVRFSSAGYPLVDLIQLPEFASCHNKPTDKDRWNCRASVWQSKFRNQTRYDYSFPDASLRMAFFNPSMAGYTYGMGQLDPLRALMASDMVHRISGLPELSVERPQEIYDAIIDPMSTCHYLAATIRLVLDAYREEAGFDLSRNIGLTATLYNLGREDGKAYELRSANKKLTRERELRYPRVNFYGWFVNDREKEIRAILEEHTAAAAIAQ